ncbi:MAG: DUF3800 domain-containing protein [Nitrospirae bacterium]|nr:DUF3800 domain-containing protein [Nitrospirota bacterium]MBF0535021.1 DUF3800 domain-containing protein [Nitrospirota bacterium]MBF0616529.1 DUF3800 domain-containing protein [Nitrospirota bacterium]
MSELYNIYCDESCHLEHDQQKAMVLGAIWCKRDKASEISVRIREKKIEHGISKDFEIKWTKVSPAKKAFYLGLVDYFFDDNDLHFRALIVPDKSKLDHLKHGQTHDEWYYKMYFDMLKVIISPEHTYRIYLDIKDTRGGKRVKKLHEVLSNNRYDFSKTIIDFIQLVRSHEVEVLQLTDLLTGAISYLNRGLSGNSAKEAIIQRIKERSHYCLTKTTLLLENKVNLFRWNASEANND